MNAEVDASRNFVAPWVFAGSCDHEPHSIAEAWAILDGPAGQVGVGKTGSGDDAMTQTGPTAVPKS